MNLKLSKTITNKLEKNSINLPSLTLVAVATRDVIATYKALKYSSSQINFKEILLISDFNPKPSDNDIKFVKISPFQSIKEWGKFVVFDLHKFIQTSHIMMIHADGFIINPFRWQESFLNYDYIGAPFPLPRDNFSYRDYYGNIIRVGNAISIRSKKILELPSKLDLDWEAADQGHYNDDGFLSVQHRHTLLRYGINYAPLSIAKYFSREVTTAENRDIEPFAFHKWQGRNSSYPSFCTKKSLMNKISKLIQKLRLHS